MLNFKFIIRLRKGESIKKSNSNSPRQQRLDEKTKKLLPSSYNEFKKEWEDSKEGKENRKHFIPEKKENLIKLKQLKKEKKNLRKSKFLRQGKQMISVQRAIKRTNRSISYAKTKLNSKSKKSRK